VVKKEFNHEDHKGSHKVSQRILKMNDEETYKKFLDKDKLINFVFLSVKLRVPLW
jgi:hypothetical protein